MEIKMNPIQIYNNIGCEFIYDTDKFIIGGPLPGYNTLQESHVGSYIPYLVRNINKNKIDWEIGIGLVSLEGSKIVVSRVEKIQSHGSLSDSGQKVFYLFVNADNYSSGFNNVIIKDGDFVALPTKATYLVDTSSGLVHAKLPNASDCQNIEIQFKVVSDNGGRLDISDSGNFHLIIRDSGSFTSVVSNGIEWIVLNTIENQSSWSAFSIDNEPQFGALSNPGGNDGSFQYKDGSSFSGSNVFWGANNKVLLGPDTTEQNAKHILPTSGNYDTVINNTKNKSDFIVHGSGLPAGYLPKNLIFTYDGKLGLNMPSGTKPQTVLHIVNNSCKEALRIENLSACPSHVPNVTLYHKPPSVDSGSTISKIVMSSRDSNKNKTDYASIEAIAKNTTAGSTQGQVSVSVNAGSTAVTGLSIAPDNTVLGYSDYRLKVAPNSGIKLENASAGSALSINNTSINIDTAGTTNIGGQTVSVTGANITLNQTAIINSSGLALPLLPKNQLLAANSFGYLAPATGFSLGGIGPNRILSTNSNGVVIGSYPNNAFLVSYDDIQWQKYPYRSASVCLRQLTFLETVSANEFSVGDQIAVVTGVAPNQGVLYRTIEQLDLDGANVATALLDQNVTSVDSGVSCLSISKGGVLTNQVSASGTQSDATAIVLSSRPEIDTVFNTKKKNINFKVYGSENNPAFNVIANASLEPVKSGIYHKYANHFKTPNGDDIDPFPTLFTSAGQGVTALNNSVNFGNILSEIWPNRVSTVGTNGRRSFYGTYDQNGNVYEWIEDKNPNSVSVVQNVCGGSWRTTTVDGLRSIISTPYELQLDDIGFRICSRFGYENNNLNNSLNLSFAPVTDLDNLSDVSPLYTESYDNRSGLNIQPQPTSILDLGKVDHPYQISRYEITNAQYAAFLNAVNKTAIHNLYDNRMSSEDMGGISVSGSDGSYVYSTKTNMSDKPVVFVNYLNAIRFINWLHNGAPTGTGLDASHIEDGAYTINTNLTSTIITKNRDQKYWLPDLNEWHKAAYFKPVYDITETNRSAVTVRTDVPAEVSSGVLASFTVSGSIYADEIVVGQNINATGSLIRTNISQSDIATVNLLSGYPEYGLNVGPTGNVSISAGSASWDGSYSNIISPSSIQLATTGTMKLISNNPIIMSGLYVDDIFIKNLSYRDPDTGAVVEGGIFPGPNGGFVFKDLESNNAKASNILKLIDVGNNASGINLSMAGSLQPIYSNENSVLDGFQNMLLGTNVEGLDNTAVYIGSGTTDTPMSLVVDSIRIGPPIASFSGSLLTHNGAGLALWTPNDFLRAEGITWNRNIKRAVEIKDSNTLIFSQKDPQEGGTGSIDIETVLNEFAIDDTIAIYNQLREVEYVKVANITLVDGDQVIPSSFFTNSGALEITVCPALTAGFIGGTQVEDAQGNAIGNLAYAFSVQKGGYLDMSIEPNAKSSFSCLSSADDRYRFKPSTANTISIRPGKYTTFNKVAEDIDFGIYGYKDTLYNRYEPGLFNTDSYGRPTGLIPAFYIDVYKENSVQGSISSGVFRESSTVIATGISLDESAKITINTNNPYIVTSLSGVKRGYIKPNARYANGYYVSGINDLTTYADLTVNGYTFSNGLITNELVLNSTSTNALVPNAPLTINSLGQVVSIIPPPQPTIPNAPSGVIGNAGNASVRLSWTAPEFNGNSLINDYDIEYSAGGEWIKYTEGNTSFDTSIVINGLENGTGYRFRVYAKNSIGTSPASAQSDIVTPTSDAPMAPTNFRVEDRTDDAVIVAWNPVTTAGSSPVQNYIVQAIASTNPPTPLDWTYSAQTKTTSELNVTFTDILPGPRYYFRVRAQNNTYQGSYASMYSNGTDTPPTTEPEPIVDVSNDWDFGEIAFTGVCL